MDERIRFHLDEHMDNAISRALLAAGIDVSTSHSAQLLSQKDDAQMAYAVSQRRMLVTDDVDFLGMSDRQPDHPGIVFCHRNSRTLGQIIQTLVWLHSNFKPPEVIGRVIHVARKLPGG